MADRTYNHIDAFPTGPSVSITENLVEDSRNTTVTASTVAPNDGKVDIGLTLNFNSTGTSQVFQLAFRGSARWTVFNGLVNCYLYYELDNSGTYVDLAYTQVGDPSSNPNTASLNSTSYFSGLTAGAHTLKLYIETIGSGTREWQLLDSPEPLAQLRYFTITSS